MSHSINFLQAQSSKETFNSNKDACWPLLEFQILLEKREKKGREGAQTTKQNTKPNMIHK